MKRFAVIAHPYQEGFPTDVHKLLRNYHFESLDEEHLLVLCDIHPSKLDAVDFHPKVLLMPSLYSSKTIHSHAHGRNKSTHYLTLNKCLGLEPEHTAIHLAERAHDLYGRKFALDV
jgi:hypothetical protein